jgi:hypothetical protein
MFAASHQAHLFSLLITSPSIFFIFLGGAVLFLRLLTGSRFLYEMTLPNPYRSCSDKSPLREWDPGPAKRSAGVLPTLHPNHRVYRVPGLFSSCPNWVHLTPSPPRECCSFLLWVQWGRKTRLRGRGWGDPIPKKGHIFGARCRMA